MIKKITEAGKNEKGQDEYKIETIPEVYVTVFPNAIALISGVAYVYHNTAAEAKKFEDDFSNPDNNQFDILRKYGFIKD